MQEIIILKIFLKLKKNANNGQYLNIMKISGAGQNWHITCKIGAKNISY